jgi:hypothetical protein
MVGQLFDGDGKFLHGFTIVSNPFSADCSTLRPDAGPQISPHVPIVSTYVTSLETTELQKPDPVAW